MSGKSAETLEKKGNDFDLKSFWAAEQQEHIEVASKTFETLKKEFFALKIRLSL